MDCFDYYSIRLLSLTHNNVTISMNSWFSMESDDTCRHLFDTYKISLLFNWRCYL